MHYPVFRAEDGGVLRIDYCVKVKEAKTEHLPIYCYRVPASTEYRQLADIVEKMVEGEKLLHRPLGRCSGGELQRVLLALALHPAPDLLVLDEPVSGVDQNGLQMFLDTVVRLKEHHHMAILLVSHDLNVVRQYADHVVLLDKTVLKQGKPDDVFASPEFQKVFGLGAKTLNAQRLHGAERWMGRKAETTEEEIARAAAVVDDETKGGRA